MFKKEGIVKTPVNKCIGTTMHIQKHFASVYFEISANICEHNNMVRGTWKNPFHFPPFNSSSTSPLYGINKRKPKKKKTLFKSKNLPTIEISKPFAIFRVRKMLPRPLMHFFIPLVKIRKKINYSKKNKRYVLRQFLDFESLGMQVLKPLVFLSEPTCRLIWTCACRQEGGHTTTFGPILTVVVAFLTSP